MAPLSYTIITPCPLKLKNLFHRSSDTSATADSAPSLLHLDPWAHIALALILFIVFFVLSYTIYNCCVSASVKHEPIPEYQSAQMPEKPKKTRKSEADKWKSTSQCDLLSRESYMASLQSTPVESSFSRSSIDSSFAFDYSSVCTPPQVHTSRFSSHMPLLPLSPKTPTPVSRYGHACQARGPPAHLDLHNIRFVAPKNQIVMSPSTVMIWQDPKLSPVHSTIIPPSPTQESPLRAVQGRRIPSDRGF